MEEALKEGMPKDAESVYPYLPMWTKFPDFEKVINSNHKDYL